MIDKYSKNRGKQYEAYYVYAHEFYLAILLKMEIENFVDDMIQLISLSAGNNTYQKGGKKRKQNGINSSQKDTSEQVPLKQMIKCMCNAPRPSKIKAIMGQNLEIYGSWHE